MLILSAACVVDSLGLLPMHADNAGNATSGHPFFGALFLFIGTMLVAETLAGGIWRRNRLRMMLWPTALFASASGMFIVSYVQPTEKSLHFSLAFLLLLGSIFEGRHRMGLISHSGADAFAIPALIVGGFAIGPMHANGTLLYSAATNTHLLVGMSGWALAGVKLMRFHFGPTVALEASFATGVMALGLSLLLVEQFHGVH